MKKAANFLAGVALAAAGIAIQVWLWIGADAVGAGLSAGVRVAGVAVPLMMPVIAGIGLVVLGIVVGYRGAAPGKRST